MAGVFQPIEALIAVEKARLRQGLSRSLSGTAVALLAVLAGLQGLALVLVGSYVSLSRTLSPWAAGLWVGGLVLLVAALTLAWAVHSLRGPDRDTEARIARQALETPPSAASTPGLLGIAAAELLGKTHLKARDIALVALVAGLALGISPRLRSQVFGGHSPRRDPDQGAFGK